MDAEVTLRGYLSDLADIARQFEIKELSAYNWLKFSLSEFATLSLQDRFVKIKFQISHIMNWICPIL